jgi:hypothetical protein
MTLVIARQGVRAYVARMPAVVLRIAMLIALAFMPLGMASAPAAVSNVPGATAGHCDEHQKPADAPARMDMHCAVCAALPASDPVNVEELEPQAPELFSAMNALSDTKPEIATPPPRLA